MNKVCVVSVRCNPQLGALINAVSEGNKSEFIRNAIEDKVASLNCSIEEASEIPNAVLLASLDNSEHTPKEWAGLLDAVQMIERQSPSDGFIVNEITEWHMAVSDFICDMRNGIRGDSARIYEVAPMEIVTMAQRAANVWRK